MAEDLHRAALAAQRAAYAPYSGFAVGAAIRAASGAIYSGCNVENASYPEGWCAETSAIAAMVAAGEREIVEVCVVGPGDRGDAPPITPCGGCRQRLAEFCGSGARVHAGDATGVRISWTLAELLPAAFGREGR